MAEARFLFCAGMFRSGSTLQYNIASELLERHCLGRRERWVDDHGAYFRDVQACNDLIAFKSHSLTPEIARVLSSGRGLILGCHRDIRDVVASWQAKQGRRLGVREGIDFANDAVRRYLWWEESEGAPRLVSRYEDFAFNIRAEVLRVAAFIGAEVSADVATDIAVTLDAHSLKKRMAALAREDLVRTGGFVYDSVTLIHPDHLNGGLVGRARKELSSRLYRALSDRFGDWLLSHDYMV